MQLLQVCQNIADVLEAEQVQARRITTPVCQGSDLEQRRIRLQSIVALQPDRCQPDWSDAVFYRMEWAVLGMDICGAVFWSRAGDRGAVEKMGTAAVGRSFRKSILQTAYSYLRTWYRWGGKQHMELFAPVLRYELFSKWDPDLAGCSDQRRLSGS